MSQRPVHPVAQLYKEAITPELAVYRRIKDNPCSCCDLFDAAVMALTVNQHVVVGFGFILECPDLRCPVWQHCLHWHAKGCVEKDDWRVRFTKSNWKLNERFRLDDLMLDR